MCNSRFLQLLLQTGHCGSSLSSTFLGHSVIWTGTCIFNSLASSSTTPTFTSSSRRNSLDRNVPVKSQLRREISQPAKRLESIKKVKPASTVGAKKSNSDGRKKLNTVSDETRKFDVLALVCRQAIEENDKLQKVINANKLQLEDYQAELSHSKVGFTNLNEL